ncbi:DNA translocase FtsK [Faecalibacterium langellae]|uniref:Cell division protein FtsK n=1 Tax=Faecalibacterium langellae TaxID=3435293 RepID=A0ACC9D067_9FIRM|nr:DNA translocase FtsK [Faecalibacterium prausnitzii]PDX61548.1 cell division protein FtsK [Faecalibacterium prausnitzii]
MATKKRKSTARRAASRKKQAQQRLPAGLGTLFAGLLLVVLAFVQGDSVWRALHDVLFGLFGCGSFVLGAAVCCLAVQYTRGEDLLPKIFKLVLGLIFASGTVIVFSGIQPQGLSAFQMAAACYENGVSAWLGGGALGAVLGGSLLLLCGRPAANLIMLVLALCVSLYIFDRTPAEVWQWLCAVFGGARARGAALAQQSAERRAERAAARAAEAEDEPDEGSEDEEAEDEPEDAGFRLGLPDWLSGIRSWGHKVTEEMEAEDEGAAPQPAPAQPVAQPEPETPVITPVKVSAPRPRAAFDVDLGPDHTEVKEGGSEPIEPLIVGPGGTFGQDPLRPARKPAPQPIVPDAVETDAADFFAKPAEPVHPAAESFDTPVMTPVVPTIQPEAPAEPSAPDAVEMPETAAIQPAVPAAQGHVSAENAVAMRSAPDADGWISITAEPVEEKDISSLVAAAMEKPAASEQAAAQTPVEDAEPVDTFQYQYPPIELFERSPDESDPTAQDELKANAQKLVDTLESFGVRTRVLDISRGPAVTRYEVQPMAGVKISRITSLADDIALNLAVADVRMEAPIPGKPAVGIEVPNHKRQAVYIRSVFESQSFLRMSSPLGIALGKDIAGVAQVADLCKMPHLLIAGSTGSGKSVCVNSIIMSLVFRSSPEDVKLLLIDPKVVELAEYNGIPHLLMPVVTEPKKAAGALGSAVQEMERRYRMFAENNVRDIKSFNKLAAERLDLEKMPYIAIVIDELADLMMVVGKDVEDSICRIAQKARAAGMHLIVATQRPSVDVITGLIKANIPSRIAFAVSSQVDSRTILDGAGAEKLLGQGDMLFMPVGAPKPTRIQGTFVRDEEISRVLDFIKSSATVQYDEAMIEAMEKHAIQDGKKGSSGADSDEDSDSDPMFKQAVEVVIDAGQASTSLLQRRCKLGYARAARIMDEMEQKGVIGPYEGAKPRAVLISRQQWLEMQMNQPDE